MKLVTRFVEREFTSWLNAVAPWNMAPIAVTEFVGKSSGHVNEPEAQPLLNADAFWNISLVVVTRAESSRTA